MFLVNIHVRRALPALLCAMYAGAALPEQEAAEVLRLSGVKGGLVVHAGCGTARLTGALGARAGPFTVHGLERDPARVAAVRRQLMAAGVHGPVSVSTWAAPDLPYVDNLVNLLIVETECNLADSEAFRVLAPGGAVCRRTAAGWEVRHKPWPGGMDEWSHWLHGPDGNAVSADTTVGVSRCLQWVAPPRWSRHHNLPAGFNGLVSADGRVYYLVDDAPNAVWGPGKWSLAARDAFNGIELWRRPMPDWHMTAWGAEKRFGGRIGRFHGAPDLQAPRRVVAALGRVFVTLGFHAPVTALDGATGRVVATYPQTASAGELVVRDGVLYAARNTYDPEPGKDIVAVSIASGETLWERTGYAGIAPSSGYQSKHTNALLTVGPRHVFLVDRDRVVALDRHSGDDAWTHSLPLSDETVGDIGYRYSRFCTLLHHGNCVVLAQLHPGTQNLNRWEMKDLTIEALDADTGTRLWSFQGGSLAHVTPPDLFVANGRVWTLDPGLPANGHADARLLGLDLRSGTVTTRLDLPNITHPHHHRCYRNKATSRYLLMGEEGIEYVNLDTGEHDTHYWLRGACRYGIMPANGFIYVPPHNCACYLGTLMHGFLSLSSQPETTAAQHPPQAAQPGPAYGDAAPDGPPAAAADWPVFRHDNMRSAHVDTTLADTPEQRWEVHLDGDLSAPVAVGNHVFVASPERHLIVCLDAGSGRLQWQLPVDGPVNSPPSYHRGRLVFGTRLGTLYAVTAADGRVLWQRRVAPRTRVLTACGSLESVWPLDGSPVVMNDSVFCVAGRSMNLDGGLRIARVDLQTGALQQYTTLAAPTAPKGETDNSLLPDILVSDGRRIYMKSLHVNPDDLQDCRFEAITGRRGSTQTPEHILRCQTEMVDPSWLNCCFWAYRGCVGQQLAFDATTVYGVKGVRTLKWGGSFAHDVHRPGEGFMLRKWELRATGGPRQLWPGKQIPIQAKSMVLTAAHLCLAGIPDAAPENAFWQAYEGGQGAVLLIASRDNAATVGRFPLPAPPVYNGLAAARGRLFACLEDGRIVCFE